MNVQTPVSAARVLVVEDEILVAMLMEDYLRDLGYEVIGPAMRLERGLELARSERLDFAVLDVNLVSEVSFPIADALKARDIPFIFATGAGRQGLTPQHKGAVMLHKPFDLSDLESALGAAQVHLV